MLMIRSVNGCRRRFAAVHAQHTLRAAAATTTDDARHAVLARRPGATAHKHTLTAALGGQVAPRRRTSAKTPAPAWLSTGAPRAVSKKSVAKEDFDTLTQFLMQPSTSGEQATQARRVVETMMQEHVFAAMPGQEAALMVMVADALEDPLFVVRVYECLRDAKVPPSPMTLELAAMACATTGDWRTAMEVVQFMHAEVDNMEPSEEIYEAAITACQQAKQWIKAKRLLEDMGRYDLSPSPDAFVKCIATCIECGELTASKQLLNKLLDAHMLEQDELEEVFAILWDAVEASKDHQHALLLWAQRRRLAVSLDQELASQLIEFFACRCRDWQTSREVLAEFLRKPSPASSVRFPSASYTPAVQALLDEMKTQGFRISLAFYNAVMREFGRHRCKDQALELLTAMQASVEPSATTFHASMRACGDDFDTAKTLYDDMIARGIKPTADVAHAFVLSHYLGEQYEKVAEFIYELDLDSSEAIKNDARVLSILAMAHSHLGEHDLVLELFSDMKMRGLQPTLHVYAQAMFIYIERDQWRRALMLFDHLNEQSGMSTDKLYGNRSIWEAAVLAAVEGDQSDRLFDMFRRIVRDEIKISSKTADLIITNLTELPVQDLWQTFRSMGHLHQHAQPDGSFTSSAVVTNAALRRVVEDYDVYMAEMILSDAQDELGVELTAATYGLMLRLYASQNEVTKFNSWCVEMAHAGVELTVGTYRAILKYLGGVGNTRPEAIGPLCELVGLSVDDLAATNEVVKVGLRVLEVMRERGLPIDELCVDMFLRMDQDMDERAVLSLLSLINDKSIKATSGEDEQDVPSPQFVLGLLASLAPFFSSELVCAGVVQQLKKLDAGHCDNVLANFCASCTSDEAYQLLNALLTDRSARVLDHNVVVFLANCGASAGPDSVSAKFEYANKFCELVLHHNVEVEHRTAAFVIQLLAEAYDMDKAPVTSHAENLFLGIVRRLGFTRPQALEYACKVTNLKTRDKFEALLQRL